LELARDFISKHFLLKLKIMPSILNSLGCIYYKQEKIEKALLVFQMAHKAEQMKLQKRNEEKTPEKMSLLQCLGTVSSNIGRVSFIQKHYEDATAHCLDALQNRKNAFGEKHIEVYFTSYNLGLIKQK